MEDEDPRVLYRYAVVKLELNGGIYEMKPHEPAYGPRTLALYETPIEGPISNRVIRINLRISDSVTKRVKVWFTGETVTTYQTFDIPVIDISSHGDIDTMEIFHYCLIDDTVEACRRRQDKQRINRHEYLCLRSPPAPSQPAAPPSPPPSPPQQSQALRTEIPKFVADMIKSEAIRDKKSCPITMNTVTSEMACSITSCFHLFDRAALATWMEKESKCPICKTAVTFTVPV
jgi:hypothetical protein